MRTPTMMIRSSRPLLSTSARGLLKTPASIAPFATSQTQRPTSYAASRARLPTTLSSAQLAPLIQRAQFAAKLGPDVKLEKELARKKLESNPEQVTSQSSVRSTYEGSQVTPGNESTIDGVKQDIVRSSRTATQSRMSNWLTDTLYRIRIGW